MSLGLFLISLPSSLVVWGAINAITYVYRVDPAWFAPAVYLMPVLAGAGWGGLAAWWLSRRKLRTAAPARHPVRVSKRDDG